MGNSSHCCAPDKKRADDEAVFIRSQDCEDSTDWRHPHAPGRLEVAKSAMMEPSHLAKSAFEKLGPAFCEEFSRAEDRELPELGPFLYPDGSTYLGQYRHGRRHGKGKMVGLAGGLTLGYWSEDLLERWATAIEPDGSWYRGEVRKGLRHGQGRSENCRDEKAAFTGSWVAGKRNGSGEESLADGSVYRGDFRGDLRSGRGVQSGPDGSQYQGQFEAGLRHGRGALRRADGTSYEGEFSFGRADGKGRTAWLDGRVYEGDHKDGLPHGFGELLLPDGSRHVGMWEAGLRSGHGHQTAPDGKQTKAFWRKDKLE